MKYNFFTENPFSEEAQNKPSKPRRKIKGYTPTKKEKDAYEALKKLAGDKKEGGLFPEKYKSERQEDKPSTKAQFFRRVLETYGRAYSHILKIVIIEVNGVPMTKKVKANMSITKYLNGVTRAIIDSIAKRGYLEILTGYRKGTATLGVTDAQAWVKGGFIIHIEIKGTGDTEGDAQIKLRQEAEALGHPWFVFKDIEQLKEIHRYILSIVK